jgi:hypothetical protein
MPYDPISGNWVSEDEGFDYGGNYTTQYFPEDGSVMYFDASGNVIGSTAGADNGVSQYTTAQRVAEVAKTLGKDAFNAIKGAFTKDGVVDYGKLLGAAGGLAAGMGLFGSDDKPKGYQGTVPKLEVARQQVANTYDPNRRPGSGGLRYFTDTQYVPQGDATALAAAQAAAGTQATGLAALNAANPARQATAPLTFAPLPAIPTAAAPPAAAAAARSASDVIKDLPVPKYNMGGIATLAHGKYLDGPTDGMADKLPANIDGKQEARLSHGEFVIPADVVSHLGNGNSSAGAERLYSMMDRIRQARTGTKKQGKQINPNKYVPA